MSQGQFRNNRRSLWLVSTAVLLFSITTLLLNLDGSKAQSQINSWAGRLMAKESLARLEEPVALTPVSPMVAPIEAEVKVEASPLVPAKSPISRTRPAADAVPMFAPYAETNDEGLESTARVYWGAYVDGVPFDMSKLDQFESSVGKRVSIVHWGSAWVVEGKYHHFQPQMFERIRKHGAIPMNDWASWALGGGVDQADFQLRDLYEGKHDAFVRQWATDAKAWGKPLLLRFNHEMNGWWYPWGEQANGNQPGDYVRAWRHVHDIFTEVGATNVGWVWSANVIHDSRLTPVRDLYPGDDYVDWVGMDGYNWGSIRDRNWDSFYEVFKRTYDELTALAPAKPLMVSEVASAETGGPFGRPGSKAAWIQDTLSGQLQVNFPKVRAFVWFNSADNDTEMEWPVESSQASIEAFAAAISSEYYAGNDFADLTNIEALNLPNEPRRRDK